MGGKDCRRSGSLAEPDATLFQSGIRSSPRFDIERPSACAEIQEDQAPEELESRLKDRTWPADVILAEQSPFIKDCHILQVNFSIRDFISGNAPDELIAPELNILYGVTKQNQFVIAQGNSFSSVCTAEAMLLLDVVRRHNLNPSALRGNLVQVKSGIDDGRLETVCDSLSRRLKGTGIEVDFRRFDLGDIPDQSSRTKSAVSILEDLVARQGSAIVSAQDGEMPAVIIVDALLQRGAEKVAVIREPLHGWQITVNASLIASRLGKNFETLQCYKPEIPFLSETEIESPVVRNRPAIVAPPRLIEKFTPASLDELRLGDLFVTSLNGTRRLIIADNGWDAENRAMTVLVKKKSDALDLQKISLNANSLAAVYVVLRPLASAPRILPGLGPPGDRPLDARIDAVHLINNHVILKNAETLLGFGPDGTTLNRKCQLSAAGDATLMSVDGFVDCTTGRLDVYKNNLPASSLIPIQIEYELCMASATSESTPGIRINTFSELDSELSYNLACAGLIASRFLTPIPELPPL